MVRARLWDRARMVLLIAAIAALALLGAHAGQRAMAATPAGTPSRIEVPVQPTLFMDVLGYTVGNVDELRGFGTQSEVKQYVAVTSKGKETIASVAAGTKRSAFSVVRRVDANMSLWNWRQDVERSPLTARHGGSFELYSATGTMVARWEFTNAWPSRYEVAAEGTAAVETVWFTCDDIKRVK